MNRSFLAASVAGILVACAVGFAAEGPKAPSTPQPSAPSDSIPQGDRQSLHELATEKEATEIELAKLRLREGARFRDVAGRFRQSGDSLTFIDGENREIGGLPNLNLERIIRTLKSFEEPESMTWSVSGVITEFSGRNYLLISRAVFKEASPPPTPESLTKEVSLSD